MKGQLEVKAGRSQVKCSVRSRAWLTVSNSAQSPFMMRTDRHMFLDFWSNSKKTFHPICDKSLLPVKCNMPLRTGICS